MANAISKVRHEYLQDWLRSHKITRKQLADDVGVISIQGSWNSEKGLPIEWINLWAKKYGWSQEQKYRFAFDEDWTPPVDEPTLEKGFAIMMDAWAKQKKEEV